MEELCGSAQRVIIARQSGLESGFAEVQVAVETCGGVIGDLHDESIDEIDDTGFGVAKEVDDGQFGRLCRESGGNEQSALPVTICRAQDIDEDGGNVSGD